LKSFDEIEKNNGQFTLQLVAEEHGIVQRRAEIIPGRFYAFKTEAPAVNLNEEFVRAFTRKSYLDLNPVGLLLFHENWKEVNLVLNLKAIPPLAASKILEAYWRFSQMNDLAKVFDSSTGELLPLDMRRLIDCRFYLITPSALSSILGIDNLNYAINKYSMDQVLEARLIDWDKFGMLINPKLSTHGLFPDPINIAAVFDDFLKNSLT
jgi:hypothetical protein